MGKLRKQVYLEIDEVLDPSLAQEEKMKKEIEGFDRFVAGLKEKVIIK